MLKRIQLSLAVVQALALFVFELDRVRADEKAPCFDTFAGTYNAANMMKAIAVGRYFGVSAVVLWC